MKPNLSATREEERSTHSELARGSRINIPNAARRTTTSNGVDDVTRLVPNLDGIDNLVAAPPARRHQHSGQCRDDWNEEQGPDEFSHRSLIIGNEPCERLLD